MLLKDVLRFDYTKLRRRIKQICVTQDEFSKQMNLSTTSISDKLNNKVEFKQSEINRACEVLEIGPAEISCYFFTESVKEA